MSGQTNKAPSVLAMSSTPAQLNQAVSIRAAPQSMGLEGTIDFAIGGVAIVGCTNMPVETTGVAICNTSFSQLGTFIVTATYSRDPNTSPSSASLTLTVGKVAAGPYLAFFPGAPVFDGPLTVSILLWPVAGVAAPTGTVTFRDAGATLAVVPVGGDNRATLVSPSASMPPFSAGAHSVSADYSGDANYQASTTTVAITVVKSPATLSLASAPAQLGQAVTIKAAVNPVSAASGGTVSFTNGGKTITGCSSVPTQNGIATCNTSFSQLGDYSIGAGYSGDANTASGTASMQLSVGKAVANIYSASTTAAPVFGAPVTIDALLLGAAGLPGPTGTVTFSEGAVARAPVPVSADGRASLVLPASTQGPLSVGTHSFVAVYSGDANNTSSTAAPLNLVIQKTPTSVLLTASLGAPLTATVTVLPPGAGTPTGTVQFFQAGVLIGAAPVVQLGSSFTATVPAGSPGGSIWAVYQGDANFGSSASQSVTVPARAQVSIGSSQNPAIAGQPVTFTVQVTATSGAGAPSGTVQLSADGIGVGMARLASGQANITATLSVGPHSIAANYSGDSVYPASTANFQQVMSKSVISLSLTSSFSTTVYGQPVTLTAQFGMQQGVAPAGTVQFSDGATAIGQAQISGGVATLVTANLSAGTHSITAIWSGDDNSAAAGSAPLTQIVNKAQSSTALAISGLTLNAAVTAVAPGAGTPTGSLRFLDAATNTVLAESALAGSSAATPLSSIADPIVAVYSGDSNFQSSSSGALMPLAAVNAASYTAASFAPDEIVTLFGSNLAAGMVSGTAAPAALLGGTTVTVTDSAGVKHSAGILFVSPAQASFLIPADTPPGPATVIVTNADRPAVSTAILVTPVAPGLFTVNSNGQGVPAGQIIRVHADGTQDAPQDLAVFDKVQNLWVPTPIDLGAPADTVYLMLYGTGLRHSKVTPVCTIAGQQIPVLFAGAQGGFPGLDQVNLVLPQSLRGAGTVDLALVADGTAANIVTLAFQ
ncbi:MAG TPA: Ig-like domain repeat protein [Bryobacteraceae bacterium]|nr:Ig-like domain repeat protein [Bryobacteraceae bacterium]